MKLNCSHPFYGQLFLTWELSNFILNPSRLSANSSLGSLSSAVTCAARSHLKKSFSSSEHLSRALPGKLKKQHNMAPSTTTKTGQPFQREQLDQLLKRRTFVSQSFKAYGGVAGLFDYGPPLHALEVNVIAFWRDHFVEE